MSAFVNPFTHYLRIRYAECDAQKVVFNARYADYVDVAVTEFMRALGFEKEMVSGELDYQLVKQTIEWKASARFDQVLAIAVSARQLGTTSFGLRTEFRIADRDAVIAMADTVYVLVDAVTLQKRELPPRFRAALESGAVGIWSDHAGYLI
jgi:acyl-CoA thioester hydrolase